jgi:REP element-mobilizing transposase RayT
MGLRGRTAIHGETAFFVTTTVLEHRPVFTCDRYCDILIRNIKHYQQQYGFFVLGYVIMPTHFHWVVETDPAKGTISDIMRDLKKYSSWDILNALEKDGQTDLCQFFSQAAQGVKGQKRRFWTFRFDDKAIRHSDMLRTKLEYVHYNPVRAGLVTEPEDYKYSSARNYILDDHSVLFVHTDRFM